MDALQWCRGRLEVPGHPLAASLRFIGSPDHERLLAFRALVGEIASLADAGLDPSIVAAKAGWWRTALTEGANHPALTALTESGAAERVPPTEILGLLKSVLSAGTEHRFERFEELWAHALSIGGEAARLEVRMVDGWTVDHEPPAAAIGAAGYLLRVVRDLASDARANRWLVPLDLQAQFQVGRKEALNAEAGPGWDGLVRTLVERAVRAGSRSREQLPALQRHLHLQWALDRRLAAQLARRPGQILERRILPGHTGNVWTAWRCARRLRARSRLQY
jgi:phytoene/squalene synthetase